MGHASQCRPVSGEAAARACFVDQLGGPPQNGPLPKRKRSALVTRSHAAMRPPHATLAFLRSPANLAVQCRRQHCRRCPHWPWLPCWPCAHRRHAFCDKVCAGLSCGETRCGRRPRSRQTHAKALPVDHGRVLTQKCICSHRSHMSPRPSCSAPLCRSTLPRSRNHDADCQHEVRPLAPSPGPASMPPLLAGRVAHRRASVRAFRRSLKASVVRAAPSTARRVRRRGDCIG
jgi:hypothetical protein